MPPRHTGESRTSPRRLQAAERQRQALELRKGGVTFNAIAQALGFRSRQAAFESVHAGLRATLQEPADELRILDAERLDGLLLAVWSQARAGSLPHIATALTILARKAKLLGLDVVLPQVGSSRNNPLWTQSTEAIDLSAATDADLDVIIEKARAIQEAGQLSKGSR